MAKRKNEDVLTRRYRLYGYYCDELNEYCVEKMTDADICITLLEYTQRSKEDPNFEWIDVMSEEGEVIGFLIVIKNPEWDIDYFIAQTYISQRFRRQGIMKKVVTDYLTNHKGKYGLYILDKNYKAKTFWKSIENECNLGSCLLEEQTPQEEGVTLYGFINE